MAAQATDDVWCSDHALVLIAGMRGTTPDETGALLASIGEDLAAIKGSVAAMDRATQESNLLGHVSSALARASPLHLGLANKTISALWGALLGGMTPTLEALAAAATKAEKLPEPDLPDYQAVLAARISQPGGEDVATLASQLTTWLRNSW